MDALPNSKVGADSLNCIAYVKLNIPAEGVVNKEVTGLISPPNKVDFDIDFSST